MISLLPQWLVRSSGPVLLGSMALAVGTGGLDRGVSRADDATLELRATRFWVQSISETEILAMVSVPYSLGSPTGTGASGRVALDLQLRITDNTGLTLVADTVRYRIPANLRQPGAMAQEQLEFTVKPGRYYLVATVLDSVSGRTTRDSVSFEGFAEAPLTSDLLIASSIRAAESRQDTALGAGEFARGGLRLIANPETRIDLTRPSIAFLMEAYARTATKAKLELTLTTIAGDDVVGISPREYDIPVGGRVIAQEIPLDGIPQGRYMLEAQLTMDGKKTRREATFTVSDPDVALRRWVEQRRIAMRTDEGYFTDMDSDSALDAAFDVLSVRTRNSDELRAWSKDLSIEGKQRFLVNYWARYNPNQAVGAENPERIRFYETVRVVNTMFTEPTLVGWKTDRGRLALKYGFPDDSVYFSGGQGKPILMWKWVKGAPNWAVFIQPSPAVKTFLLVKFSRDEEPGRVDWLDLVSPATVQSQVEPFVGQQFVRDRDPTGGGGGG